MFVFNLVMSKVEIVEIQCILVDFDIVSGYVRN
jgi:hypothetical protein